ncbi:hypothetical protein Tco_0906388 [Tanacetum coccineum]|uniref:Uncharacterized protein n=1 Tax=Tanacetum coccineum TaxID=301880 RepID=A0ABQ5CJJ1_9ASTR
MAYQSVEGWSSKGASASDGAKYSGYSGSGTYGTSHVKVGARDPTRNQEMVGAQVRAHSQEMVELLATWGVHRSNGVLGWLEKAKALVARGVVKASSLGVVWMMLYGGIERARVVSRVVVMIVLLMLRALVPWLTLVGGDSEEPESDGVGVRRRESSKKHSIRESHVATLGHAYHSVGDVIGKIEGFANGETIEHIAQACVWMIFVSGEAYDIFTKNEFPFFEHFFQFGVNSFGMDRGRFCHLLLYGVWVRFLYETRHHESRMVLREEEDKYLD